MLTSERSLDRDVQQTLTHRASTLVRLTPVDRVALRVGLWLLLRSTRRLHARHDHDAHLHDLARHRALLARDAVGFEHLQRGHRA